MENAYTIKEVAQYLGVQDKTVYNYIKAGLLSASKPGKRWIVSESDLQRFVEDGRQTSYARIPLTENELQLVEGFRDLDPDEQHTMMNTLYQLRQDYSEDE